jgi:lauroyl/myristoyl acyltransferase
MVVELFLKQKVKKFSLHLLMKLKNLHIVQLLEYLAIMVIALPLYWMPRRMALRAGEYIGTLMYYLLPRRRQIGFKNLTIALVTACQTRKECVFCVLISEFGQNNRRSAAFSENEQGTMCAQKSRLSDRRIAECYEQRARMIYLAAPHRQLGKCPRSRNQPRGTLPISWCVR